MVARTVLFIRLLAISQPTMAIHFTLSGALRGSGDVRTPLLGAAIGMYAVRLPMASFVPYFMVGSIYAVWLAMVMAHLARSVFLLWRWRLGRWQRLRV